MPKQSKSTASNKKTSSKLRIKLKAYDHKVIDKACDEIVKVAERYGVNIVGPVPLPTEIHKYTVNRSTFVTEQSKEQFEMRIHKRLIDLLEPKQKIIDSLMDLNLPAGVDIEIKM